VNIVFWQNMKAFHQAAHIRALSELIDGDVIWVVEEELSTERRSQGWPDSDVGKTQVIICPDQETIKRLCQMNETETIHIFSGISAFPLVKEGFMRIFPSKALMGLLQENRDNQGVQGRIRLLRYRAHYLRFGRRISFILNMGYTGKNGGRNWYRRCGYPDLIIYPYGYFPELPDESNRIAISQRNTFNMIFVGQHIHRKGLDILLESLSYINNPNWILQIIGDGPLKNKLQKLACKLRISQNLRFSPSMGNSEAMNLVETSDLLILPSRFDGWGVVINEALLRGVPVVCSDRCGGQDLLQESWRGETFISESVDDLRRILQRRIENGSPSLNERLRIRKWAAENTSGDIAAKYLLDVIANVKGEGPRPVPPWLVKPD
jgi:glycosyltransferase involved in cell wall biosynthesis